MGLAGIGIGKLLIILVIVLLFFGTNKLKSLGGDIGGAIKGFKKALTDEEAEAKASEKLADAKKAEEAESKSGS
jgi:sec-independent protein translocase protein TatA